MTRVFIHVESPMALPSKPYRLAACTPDRNWVFEANIQWPGVDVHDDEVSRSFTGRGVSFAGGGARVTCYDTAPVVLAIFQEWLELAGVRKDLELWTESHQQSWRELNALGLHSLPIYDLSTFVRLSGLDFILEGVIAHRDAVGKAGAASPRMGCYKQAILFNTVRRKTNILQ